MVLCMMLTTTRSNVSSSGSQAWAADAWSLLTQNDLTVNPACVKASAMRCALLFFPIVTKAIFCPAFSGKVSSSLRSMVTASS